MTSSIQKKHLPVSSNVQPSTPVPIQVPVAVPIPVQAPSFSSSIPPPTVGGVCRGETEEFVHFLFREGFLKKGSRMECYDFHSITPSLSYLIQKNSENPVNGCHTVVSTHSSLALKKQSHHPHHGKSLNFAVRPNLKDENVDLNLQKPGTSLDSSNSVKTDSQKQFDDWRAYDIGIGLLLYGETACFVLARMIELAYMGVGNCGLVTCCVLCQGLNYLENKSKGVSVGNGISQLSTGAQPGGSEACVGQKMLRCGMVAELPVGVLGNVFLLNPYLDVGEIQAIIELEVRDSSSVKQVFACRSDLVELGMANFELSTKSPCFLLAVKCSIDLTLPIYVYKRSSESNSHSMRSLKEGDILVGRDFQFSIETLMSLYTWLKNHLLNPKSPFFDLDYGKFYYSRALELLSNIEYIVRVSGGAEKTVSPVGGNVSLKDVGLGICGGGSGFSRQFGIPKFRTPNSRCSISTAASTNTPNVGDIRPDLAASKASLCPGGLLPGGGEVPVQGGGVQGVAGTQELSTPAGGQDYSSSSQPAPVPAVPAPARGKRSSVKFANTITPGQNNSTVSTLVPGTIVRFRSQIPVDAKLIQGVPETDYFTHVQQVYYHFQKGEWRAVYGPSKNRQQKSFSVNKYGFYEAKRLAEEWRLRYLYSNPNGTNNQQGAAYGKCAQCGEDLTGKSGSSGCPACGCKYGPNVTYEGTRSSGGSTKCKTGRKRRSSRVEMERGGGAGRVASLQGGCIPAKVPNKGNGVCSLEGTSGYAQSKMGGEGLREISDLVAGSGRDVIGGRGVVESRSPRMVGQNGTGGGNVSGSGSGAGEGSVYSPMDGMIAFGNAEFSATISEQKPCTGKLPLMSSQSPKNNPILHPAITGGVEGAGFLGPDPGFNKNPAPSQPQPPPPPPPSHNSRDLPVTSTTPANTSGGLNGGGGYDQVQKPFEEDKLMNIPSYGGGVGMLPVGSGNGSIRSVGGTSKLTSSPSLGRIISSASSNTTSSSTPMMISETSSPSVPSPVSVGVNSCSNVVSPDKQQSILAGTGASAAATMTGGGGAVMPKGAVATPTASGLMHPVSESPYSVAPDSARGVYAVQPGRIGSSQPGTDPSPSSQGEGVLGKGPMMISQSSQGGLPMAFPASVHHYPGRFPTSMPASESSYGCISPVIEDTCWSPANNEAMTSSSVSADSSLAGGMVAAVSSSSVGLCSSAGGAIAIAASNTPRSPGSSTSNVGKHPSVGSGANSVGGDGVVMEGGCLSRKISVKEGVGSGCLSSSVGKEVSACVVVGSGGSVDEGRPGGRVEGGRSNGGGDGSGDSVAGASGGESSDRRDGGPDTGRGSGNPWIKRNAWDEDLIIDSFFVG